MTPTKQKILTAALDLFSTVPYGEVSILQIAKNAGVSNGIIYNYFRNKEDLFLYFMDDILKKLETALSHVRGRSVEERLESYLECNIDFTGRETKLIKLFRDGQYRFPNYEKNILKVYLKALEKVFERKLELYEARYIISAVRFINISYHCRGLSYEKKFLVDILLHGFSELSTLSLEKIYELDFYERILLNSRNTRHELIKKGEEFFGEREYHDVKVKEITEKIDISVGSFYSWFETKEQFLVDIVEKLKKEILFLLSDNYREELGINDLFVMYFHVFMEYFQRAKYKYKLIRDVEFLNFDIYMDFLSRMESFFISTLEETRYSWDEKRLISNVALGVIHYMGIEIFLHEKVKEPSVLLRKMSVFMENGIKIKHIRLTYRKKSSNKELRVYSKLHKGGEQCLE